MTSCANTTLAQRIEDVQSRIKAAAIRSGRTNEAVTLVAVSKKISVEIMQQAHELNLSIFGESYVQEVETKADSFGSDVRFDLIGALQRNKAKRAVGLCTLIHSVDRVELADAISKAAVNKDIEQQVLVQVNVSGEASKSGATPDDTLRLCDYVLKLPNIHLQGLMAIGRWQGVFGEDLEEIRRNEFIRMRELKCNIEQSLGCFLPELSMGMSDDFEIAVEEGATLVRVGSAIFGSRCSGEL